MAASLQGEALTVDGSTAVLSWQGGLGTMAGYGTYGSGTLTLEVSYNGSGGTYFAVGNETTLSVDGHGNFDLPAGVHLRSTLASSSGASLTIEILSRRPHA